eukprot:32174-Eustigmatos_ZCMA.PRE.1
MSPEPQSVWKPSTSSAPTRTTRSNRRVAILSMRNRYVLSSFLLKREVQYVSVNHRRIQANTIITEAIKGARVLAVSDAGASRAMQDEARRLFDELLKQNVIIESKEMAVEYEKKVARGLGLDPEKYQPITLLWDFTEAMSTATSLKEANEKAKQFYQDRGHHVECTDA